jgi:beta-glucanase (GH16 family)
MAAGVIACGLQAAVAAPPVGYSLTWSDEFSGSSLDGTKWGQRYPGVRYDAINTADAVSVSGGNLVIKTYTASGTNYTGMIGTQGRFQETYGYYEARIDFNGSPGMWSAFWIQSPTYGNPLGDVATAGAEIDVAEHRVSNSGNTDPLMSDRIMSAVHWDGYAAAHQQASSLSGDLDLASGFHLYAVQWTPSTYRFFVDGVETWSNSAAVSQRSEYLILSSEVRNANWAGTIPSGGYGDQSTSTTNMTVDYVRVYTVPEPAAAFFPILVAAAWCGSRRLRAPRPPSTHPAASA